MYVQDALNPEAMLAFSLNGQPLPAEQGFPLRLILPGWYGMTQIKWLSRIQVLDRRYEGQHMTRNYLAVRAFDTPDGPMWLDTSISKTNMKSVVARVVRRPSRSGQDGRAGSIASPDRRGAGRCRLRMSTCRSTTVRGSARRSSRRAENMRGGSGR